MASKITKYRLKGTTLADGSAIVYSNSVVRGIVHSIIAKLSGLDATADVTITSPDDVVSQTILSSVDSNTDTVFRPKVLATDNAGGVLTATGNIYTEYVVFSRLKVVVAQGGVSKDFVIDILVEEY